jgi:hypothetical protein
MSFTCSFDLPFLFCFPLLLSSSFPLHSLQFFFPPFSPMPFSFIFSNPFFLPYPQLFSPLFSAIPFPFLVFSFPIILSLLTFPPILFPSASLPSLQSPLPSSLPSLEFLFLSFSRNSLAEREGKCMTHGDLPEPWINLHGSI